MSQVKLTGLFWDFFVKRRYLAAFIVFRILHTTIDRDYYILIYADNMIFKLNNTNFQLSIKRNHFVPQIHSINVYVMFNKRVGVFYHNIKHDA